ncbi:MAG: bifunctional metallophosphatase/5'-nucleotidase [Bacillota bacterium]
MPFFKKNIKLILILILINLITLILFCPSFASASSSTELNLTILHTNDEHGALIPHSATVDFHPYREDPTIGGYARLASAVNEIKNEKLASGEPVLLLSAGDYIGGSAYSWLVPEGFAPEIKIKQAIGYDAVAIGNHEYDYGPDILSEYFMEAGYPEAHQQTVVLASNTAAPFDHPLKKDNLYLDKKLIELDNGLKVGMFGLIGKQAVSNITASEPVQFKDQHETARLMVEQLKSEGAQLVIAITHSRLAEDVELALDVDGIDIIVGGHCHTPLYEPIIENDTIILQAGSLLEYMGQLELAYNPETEAIRILNSENDSPFLIKLDHNISQDPGIAELIEKYTGNLNQLLSDKTDGQFENILDTVVLSDYVIPNEPPLQESPLGNFVTDAMRLVTEEKTGRSIDIAMQANGSIRGSLEPGTMPHVLGQVSVYDLTELIGLGIGPDGSAGYPIVVAYLTGDEVRRVLEVAVLLAELMGDSYFLQFSGLRYDYNSQNATFLTIPFFDLPVPTARAVTRAEIYKGDGRQGVDDQLYEPVDWGDRELYSLATDSYILSFLPMIGEMLPQLDIVLKDAEGNPLTEDQLDKLITYTEGSELKVWRTVLEYAADQPVGESGFPEIDCYYASRAARINQVQTIPLVTWPILALMVIVIALYILIRKIKRRKAKHT